MKIKYTLIHPSAKLIKQNPQDACYDICAAFRGTQITLKPGQAKLIKTGVIIDIPEGYEAQIRPRSGLALKHSITVLNAPGTIDCGYSGEIGIILINHGKKSYQIINGDRIAQIYINKIENIYLTQVQHLNIESERGNKGFGSTGK